jgi:hypothetical protein
LSREVGSFSSFQQSVAFSRHTSEELDGVIF